MFILIQAVLSLLVILLVVVMLREQSGKEQYQVSVIVENSDDNQWSAFKYGLKMAAEDRGAEMFMVSTGAVLTPEYASQIQADFYARDAKESVDIAKRVIG